MTPFIGDPDLTVYVGDVRDVLADLPAESVDCVVTSPPYWGLRNYQVEGQIGLEPTPEEYVETMVGVFREVKRVLADHGTCWVNLGDSYASSSTYNTTNSLHTDHGWKQDGERRPNNYDVPGLKPKDLVGIPWKVAFALQADGWYLRSDIIWSKPNPMPESVTDRPTKAHEYVFLLSKRPRYWFDAEAVREPHSPGSFEHHQRYAGRYDNSMKNGGWQERGDKGATVGIRPESTGRNVRSVWEIATQPYAEAHFATFPEELVRRCLLAGCPVEVCRVCGVPRERIVERTPMVVRPGPKRAAWQASGDDHARTAVGGTVEQPATATTLGWSDCGHNDYRPGIALDPFLGSGTTAVVARKHGRRCVGVELSPEYAELVRKRTSQLSLLAESREHEPTANLPDTIPPP